MSTQIWGTYLGALGVTLHWCADVCIVVKTMELEGGVALFNWGVALFTLNIGFSLGERESDRRKKHSEGIV